MLNITMLPFKNNFLLVGKDVNIVLRMWDVCGRNKNMDVKINLNLSF